MNFHCCEKRHAVLISCAERRFVQALAYQNLKNTEIEFAKGSGAANLPDHARKLGVAWVMEMRKWFAGHIIRRDNHSVDFVEPKSSIWHCQMRPQ